jgi:hypothetical protein
MEFSLMNMLDGFDYTTRKPVRKSRKDWKTDIHLACEAGGRKVRVRNGDLLLIIPTISGHKIIAEVYGY